MKKKKHHHNNCDLRSPDTEYIDCVQNIETPSFSPNSITLVKAICICCCRGKVCLCV